MQTASRPAGGTWSPPVDLSVPGHDATEPQVAVNAGGDAVAIWSRDNGSRTVIQSVARPAGGTWSPPVNLSNADWNAREPQIAVSSAGEAIALWSRYDGIDYIVQSATGSIGGAWSQAGDVSSAGGNAVEPQVALDGGGHAVAIWSRYDGSDYVVRRATRAAGGAWGPGAVVSAAGESTKAPQVAIGPSGEAVAVWTRTDEPKDLIRGAAGSAFGLWSEPVDLSDAGKDAEAPQVAIGPTGEAVAVWERIDLGGSSVVQAAARRPAGAWSPAVSISAEGKKGEEPTLGIDSAGTAIALWSSSDGSPSVIFSSTRASGAPWGPPVTLSEIGRNATEPSIAFDAAGNGVAAWARPKSVSTTIVQAVGFDGAPPTLPAISIPAAGTMGQAVSFSVSPFDVWSAIASISWAFPGGAGASGPVATHTFPRPGAYPVSVTVADALGRAVAAGGSVRVYPKARAARNVRVRGRRAKLRVHCPSPAGCRGLAKLIAAVDLKRGKRLLHRRRTIGRSRFDIPGPMTKTVAIKLSRQGLAAVRRAGRRGAKAQLTGPGIKHRLVALLGVRRQRAGRRHSGHRR